MPCLLYALEACPVNKTQLRSIEFTLNSLSNYVDGRNCRVSKTF